MIKKRLRNEKQKNKYNNKRTNYFFLDYLNKQIWIV